MMLSHLLAHSAIPSPKTRTSLRSRLGMGVRVCMVVSFPESELGRL